MPIALAVHGGAYSIPNEDVEAHGEGCRRALDIAWRILESGGSALDTVEAAVRVLEDDPVFDAATGAHLNREGVVECDAAIMDGATLRAGSVAALRSIKNPVSVARRLLEAGGPVFLSGDGALRFALENGFEHAPPESLVVARERARWEKNRRSREETAGAVFGGDSEVPLGTVGAVALDREGHVAAATSTGGTPDKYPGRIGDSPLIGCGTYADDTSGAISCTGWGESIIRTVLARRAAERLERGESPASAAAETIAFLSARIRGLGGLIVVGSRHQAAGEGGADDARGSASDDSPVGVAFNTRRMSRAFAVEGMDPFVAVDP